MVTRDEIVEALLSEIHEGADSLMETIDECELNSEEIHVTVAGVFGRLKHLECLMEALKAVWNNK